MDCRIIMDYKIGFIQNEGLESNELDGICLGAAEGSRSSMSQGTAAGVVSRQKTRCTASASARLSACQREGRSQARLRGLIWRLSGPRDIGAWIALGF